MALTNSQINSIMRIINQRQLKNEQIYNNKLEEIHSLDSRFKEIDSQISSLCLKKARYKLGLSKEDVTFVHDKISQLADERKSLLKAYGYPKDYLTIHYDCPKCKDSGFIDNKKCDCFNKLAINLLYSDSNLKNITDKENFDTFNIDYYSDEDKDPISGLSSLHLIKLAFNDSILFVKEFDTSYKNLFFYGDTGTGKTFLSNCIARELIASNHSVIYFTAFELFELLADSTFNKNRPKPVDTSYIFNCDLLIIDDLGTEINNTFTSSQLFLCLNERILKQKPTIISTNMSLASIKEKYSDRILSRIMGNYQLRKFYGRDIRTIKQQI
ncbi:DNA replication protein DnaC [Acetitomaculum ruminis DSM 5522]|uniref:DNA replication protein DnaC n=1 Tax=Acetitomaculum ruminis DSM 5522 TaxID=1120918 RepID=A0A1I0X081_9FIRM|nr:ATP-binding protein [Acetitomaculum ruminis]SFA93756.1 DNA replication protein DnaC [Acetitomaculum ruminis DSM 5522]